MDDQALVVAFLNSMDVEDGTDQLDTAETWRAWLAWAGLPGAAPSRTRARRFRDQLRRMAMGEAPTGPLAVPAVVSFGADGAAVGGTDPLGAIAAACARLTLRGEWDRVKICPADDCLWAFYDRSRNASRQWCAMKVCGNRAKARAHRERHKG